MRILMSADTVGGVWSYALELARGLTEAGDEVLIAAMGGRMNAAQRAAAEAVPGLRVEDSDFALEWMQDPWLDLDRAALWLRKLERSFRPDIVHLNHYAHGNLPWRAPVVVVAHSCVYSWHRGVKRAAPAPEWQRYRRVVRAGLAAADRVVAPTRAMLADAEHFYGPFRSRCVIANGRREQDYPIGIKRERVLSAGRLWDEAKNVRALTGIAQRLPWEVAVAGETAHPDGGETTVAGVTYLGRLDAEAMRSAYAEASIYALPARYEPFGLSVLEAALAGCALVLGDIPSLRELWDGCARFVPPEDGAALEHALGALMESPQERLNLAARARHRAREYSAERMTENYRELYWELLQARMQPRRGALKCIS